MTMDCYYTDNDDNLEGDNSYFVRPYVKKSWNECRELGLSPEHIPKPNRVDDDVMLALQNRYLWLIDIITSYTKKIELIIPMDNAIIDIHTKDAIIISRIGNAPGLDDSYYGIGCIITEEEFGNTAISTCLDNDIPTILFGEEHFLDIFDDWACLCVPIHDTYGAIIAALSIVMPKEHANQNMLGLIMVAARGIENEIMLLYEKTELSSTNEALTELNAGVIKMASMLSHEIRNSLSTISAYVQLLQLQGVLDNVKGDKIIGEIGKINRLLNNFRSLAEPMKLKLYRCSLDELLLSVVNSLSPKARISNIDIDLIIPNDNVFVMMDAALMERVFINIVVNAIQAMEHSGGTITVSYNVENSGEKVCILFEDTGPGIAEDMIEDVFGLFYTTKEEGTGLGLAMCQYIIISHGGRILVESMEGVGTKFIVVLPCIKEKATE